MTLANEKHGSLYIMRHGKTDWNEQHKIQAVSYTHLTLPTKA